MTKKKYSLTDEHRAQFEPWRDKWITNALSTEAMTDSERAEARAAVLGLYGAANLEAPRNIVFVGSPIAGAIVAGIAAGVWWLRENPSKHQAMFGRQLSEQELQSYITPAVSLAVRAAKHKLETLKALPVPPVGSNAATDAATDAATRDATDAATYAATSDPVVRWLVGMSRYYYYHWNGGNMWSGHVAYLSFFRHVAKLDLDYSKWAHYETLAHFGPRFMHKRFCIISDRPEALKLGENNRPHCETGPSHRWRDGFELYYWRGLRIPAEWVRNKETLDPMTAITWPNIEQRRAAAELIGWANVLKKLDAKTVDKDENPQVGTLLEVELPDSGKERFLQVLCATGRIFALPVPRSCGTALEANAATFGLKPEELNIEVRT